MKKTLFYSAIILSSFLIACNERGEKTEVKTENSGTTDKKPLPNNTIDSKRTSVSVGAGGAAVKHKNTRVNVDRGGVKVGTKDVDIQIKK